MAQTVPKLDFSEFTNELGGFGKYQKYVFFLGCIAVFMPAMSVVNIIFAGNVMDHRCLIPQCEFKDNATYEKDFLNFTTPVDNSGTKWDECHRFKTINTKDMSCDSKNFNHYLPKSCSEYVYDTSILKSTTVSEFGLVCEKSWMQPLGNSAYMFGMFLGASILGDLADQIGRKKGLLVSVLILSTGGLLSAFSFNYYMFLAMRFIAGLGGVATFAVAFILIIEFVPVEYRNMCGILIEVPFALGEAFVAVLAYYFRDYRWMIVSSSAPALLLMFYYWIMPESIRWSISQGRINEVKNTIKKIEKCNKIKVSKKFIDILDSMNCIENQENQESQPRSRLDLLRHRNLRIRTLSLMYCWAAVTLGYFGLNLNSATLGGDLFINFVGLMLIEIPSYIFSYLILDRIGRKWSLSLMYLIGGIGCLISGILPSSLKTTIIVLSMIGKFGYSAAFAIIFMYTAEIFPTSMRSLGIGTCSTAARLGGIIAPFIADLSKIFKPLPLFIFGGLGVIAGIIVIFLPETLGRELPQTIQDSESFGSDQLILEFPCCGNRRNNSKIEATPIINKGFTSSQ